MFRKLLFIAAIALAPLPVIGAPKQASNPVIVEQGVSATRAMTLPLNRSQVLRVTEPVGMIVVGNPDIVDAHPLGTDQSFYLLGKSVGTTNILVYSKDHQLLAVIDVVVSADMTAVRSALHAMLPNETIQVRSINDAVALSGIVSSPAKIAQAVEIAQRFAGKDKVINQLTVSGTQQVMLQVKVAEMQRSVSKALGFKPFLNAGKPGVVGGTASGFTLATLDPINLNNFALAAGTALSGNFAFQLLVDALEEKGAVKTLAEPNLIALSGDTASFLAGGEFPVPVSQTTTAGVPTVTVEFKPFGVSLAFTPTVIDRDLINLVVAPEVSQLDTKNSVTFSGFTIPGISTRRAKTTVEVRDGQSFAIAGLLSSEFNDTMSGIPGIMDTPVLGAIFRSSSYQRNETELVIIVTPKLVQPVASTGTLVAPTDSFVPPSDGEFFIKGHTENPDSGLAPQRGGLAGHYGHIIR